MEIPQSYSETFQMKYGEGDILGRVRPATLFRFVEHVALKHATLLGITRAFNESQHMVFLIAKQAIDFRRMPRAGEMLTFVTTPEQSKRITFRRVTLIYDAQGQEVACVDSVWVLMDTNTHRILRRSPVPFDAQWVQTIERSVDMHMEKPVVFVPQGNLTAQYSQCDDNGHLNNANYFDVICDLLPIETMCQKNIRRMVVNYHREVVLGDTITLQSGEIERGVYWNGGKDGFVNFEACCMFE